MSFHAEVNIFAVDDEPFMLMLMSMALKNLGYTSINTYDSALKALESIDDLTIAPPDLILMDLNMPEMDGVEFIRSLVERNYSGSLILVSGEDERVLQAVAKLVLAHQLTVLGHLRKPVNPQMLAATLAKWEPPLHRKTSKARNNYSAMEVHAAITNDELINFYQPKVSLLTGHVMGVESLVRWRHPVNGMVLPDQFVGVAEENQLINELTRAVLARALRDTRIWRQETGLALNVAVNVTADDLNSLDFVEFVTGEAEAARLPPSCVTLEVTESGLMRDLRAPLEVLTRLRLKRFRISIDDFGTGNSSLAQLRDMPFDELKIDRGFVHRAWSDETVGAIFEASALLGKQLGMHIVTEGVEDRSDWDYVRRSKCDAAQGYFIARPMAADDLHDWINDWEERALTAV